MSNKTSLMNFVILVQNDTPLLAAKMFNRMPAIEAAHVMGQLCMMLQPEQIAALQIAIKTELESLDDVAHLHRMAEQLNGQRHTLRTVHDDGAIYQFGENVFIAWDESGAGIAHADTTLEECRKGLARYISAISGD